MLSPAQADLWAFLHGSLSPNISNLFVPRDTFETCGTFDPERIAADFEFLTRVQEDLPIGRLPMTLLTVRSHGRQWSRSDDSLLPFLIDDFHLYRILLDRVVNKHRHYSQAEANRLLRGKFARHHFHAAVRLLLDRRLAEAGAAFRGLSDFYPLPLLAALWMGSLTRRAAARWKGRSGTPSYH